MLESRSEKVPGGHTWQVTSVLEVPVERINHWFPDWLQGQRWKRPVGVSGIPTSDFDSIPRRAAGVTVASCTSVQD